MYDKFNNCILKMTKLTSKYGNRKEAYEIKNTEIILLHFRG